MSNSIYLYPMVIFIGISSLYLIWKYGWITYLVDEYRFRLFKLRDSLFALLKEQNLPASSDLYRELRRRINQMIKFADHFTFLDIMRSIIIYHSFEEYRRALSGKPYSVSDYISLADELGKDLSDGLKEDLKKLEALFYYETFIHLLKRTPLLWPPLLIILLKSIFTSTQESPKKKLANKSNVDYGHKIFDAVDKVKPTSDPELAL